MPELTQLLIDWPLFLAHRVEQNDCYLVEVVAVVFGIYLVVVGLVLEDWMAEFWYLMKMMKVVVKIYEYRAASVWYLKQQSRLMMSMKVVLAFWELLT